MRGYDTHVHTVASDGLHTLAEIVRMARAASLSGIAVTDHDTVGALAEAERLSASLDFPIIPGIELSTGYNGNPEMKNADEVHILGYWIDFRDEALLAKLRFLQDSRRLRIKKILDKLAALDMPIHTDDLSIAANQSAGRPHVAAAMVKHGYAESVGQAFKRWLGRGLPAYVARDNISPFEAVQLIIAAGGAPCLAHPSMGVSDELIEPLVEAGLCGIEVYHPEHNGMAERKYYHLARQYDLAVLGGSDFHGISDLSIGCKNTPLEELEKLHSKIAR